ncbi:glutathione S-transferase family protein [Defluviimonas salinarum]|uniref:Glutathione S-transferase family protein n=1 Tax=Defluviimonas salinarum TaxID=2992147 RepID=A0ABT3IYK6_9RHOB|nr:glutathione S-transferase family protein [Defluviimonas salinarum]MCW3780513.1 glutathione S-transferase family protein [Defluviimonas salinarum]
MGMLVDGQWTTGRGYASGDGTFRRHDAVFRNWITPDGAAGPTGTAGFKAEVGRYHLYVSPACPWSHRAMIFRALKGLEDLVPMSVVHPDMLDDGWSFARDFPGTTGDRLHDLPFLRDLYLRADPHHTGRVTVPVLWDRQRDTIVSNESADIIRMFDTAFDGLTGNSDDHHPADLRTEIGALNARIYETVNNGVYRAGFASRQAPYDAAVTALFETLDWLEDRLAHRRYLTGNRITEADWRLFPTLVRFDPVYHLHFKCNRRRLIDYPNLWAYTRALYQWPGVAATVHFDHIVRHYHYSHESINPHRIIPINPVLDFTAPHGRG